jgi:hypothetical protein
MNVISRYYQIQQHFAASEQDKRAVQRPIMKKLLEWPEIPSTGYPGNPR